MAPTLCTNQDVLDRCGKNANSIIIASSAILDRYIEISEGVIVSETRIDWITGYASVTASVKNELKSCTASHAAKQIIQYDMSGFASRATAITMLNVNQEEFLRTLKILKDLDTNKLRSVNV